LKPLTTSPNLATSRPQLQTSADEASCHKAAGTTKLNTTPYSAPHPMRSHAQLFLYTFHLNNAKNPVEVNPSAEWLMLL